jgi:hypothetical protein
VFEPTRRELIAAIGHVLAAEHAEAKHIAGGQIRFELRMEVATGGLDALVAVILLRPIIDRDRSFISAQVPRSTMGSGESATTS